MITTIKYWLFRWHFKSILGSPPNSFQRRLFFSAEKNRGILTETASRSEGASTFIIIYASFLAMFGKTVNVFGSDYLFSLSTRLLEYRGFNIYKGANYARGMDSGIFLIDLEAENAQDYFDAVSPIVSMGKAKAILIETN